MKHLIILCCILLLLCGLPAAPLLAQTDGMTTVTMGPFSGLPAAAIAGGALSLLVKVANSGAVTARQPQVTQNLFAPFPRGAQVVDLAIVPGSSTFGYVATGGECSDSGVCQLPDLPPGGALLLQATLAIDADQGDSALEVRSCLRALNAAQDCAAFRLPIGRQADLRLNQSALTPQIAPGAPALLHIEVANNGPSHVVAPGAAFTLTNQIGGLADATISAVSGGECQITAAATFTCPDLHLQAGERRPFFVTVQTPSTAPMPSHFTSCATLSAHTGFSDPVLDDNGPACTTVQLVAQGADLRVTRFVEPSNFVRAGERFTVTTLVDNLGPTPALTLTLTETIQAGGHFTVLAVADNRQAACSAPPVGAQPGLTTRCVLTGALAAGALWTVQTSATAATDMVLYSRALVMSTAPLDPDLGNNVDDTVIQIGTVADLDLRVTAALSPTLYPGALFTATVSIANGGPSPATAVLVRAPLPTGVTVHSLPAPCAVDGSTGVAVITCRLSRLEVGAATHFAMALGVSAAAPSGLHSLQVTGSSAVEDNDPSNNQAQLTLHMAATVDLQSTLTVANRTPVAGDTLNLAWTITNHGPALAQAVVVTPTLPPGLTWLTTDPACAAMTGCALGDLAAGAEITMQGTALVTRHIDCTTAHAVTVTAQTTTYDLKPHNNRAQLALAPRCQVDLRVLSLTPGGDELLVGLPFTHTFLIDNFGPGDAHAVVFEATFNAAAAFTIVAVQPSAGAARPATCTVTPTSASGAADTPLDLPASGRRLTVQCRLAAPLEAVQSADDDSALQAAAVLTPSAGAGRWVIAIAMTASQPLQINNVADVSSADEERNLADNVTQTQQPVQCNTTGNIDLGLNVQVKGRTPSESLPTVTTGRVVTLTLTTTNYSQAAVVCAQLVAQVPTYTRFHAAASTLGWNCADDAPAGTSCTYALVMSPGRQVQAIGFAIIVDDFVTGGSVTTNLTHLTDNGVDTNRANNSQETALWIVMPTRNWLPIVAR